MKPDAMELLEGVRAFLLGPVLDQVPAAMHSDVRAAAKSLANARAELDELFPLLVIECGELADALRNAYTALGEPPVGRPPQSTKSLTELTTRHGALLEEIGEVILALERISDANGRAVIISIYELLREQGRRRMGWQSVFPRDRLVSDVLRNTVVENI